MHPVPRQSLGTSRFLLVPRLCLGMRSGRLRLPKPSRSSASCTRFPGRAWEPVDLGVRCRVLPRREVGGEVVLTRSQAPPGNAVRQALPAETLAKQSFVRPVPRQSLGTSQLIAWVSSAAPGGRRRGVLTRSQAPPGNAVRQAPSAETLAKQRFVRPAPRQSLGISRLGVRCRVRCRAVLTRSQAPPGNAVRQTLPAEPLAKQSFVHPVPRQSLGTNERWAQCVPPQVKQPGSEASSGRSHITQPRMR